jgi:hypothetical protein
MSMRRVVDDGCDCVLLLTMLMIPSVAFRVGGSDCTEQPVFHVMALWDGVGMA